MPQWRQGFLRSLQSRLIMAFTLLTLAALVLAGGVFVLLKQGGEEERALDHTVAAAPVIHWGFLQRLLLGESLGDIESYVRDAAQRYDVRILVFDESGQVAVDTGGGLQGKSLTLPTSARMLSEPRLPGERYVSWRPEEGTPGSDLILVAPFAPALLQLRPGPEEPLRVRGGPVLQGFEIDYRMVVAVPQSTIARAWLDLLPGLAIAAGVALPIAALMAVIIARNITRPLNRLTTAAHQIAEGTFDIDVSVSRQDEVGRLAEAFSSMSRRLGESYQEMRTLLANVSHDVKTPLTSILGFAQALRSGVTHDEAESKRAGEVIYDEAQKLLSRLNDLIYLSELESGQAVLQREDTDLRALVEGVLGRLASAAERRGIATSTALASGITLSVDKAKLERVLENLLDNAAKFTPPGGEVSIQASLDPDHPDQARVEIRNTAPDVAPDELPRLFERFYRRDRAGIERSAGTGLGLTIARDLIALHGGTLDASLADGEIVLTARIPLARA